MKNFVKKVTAVATIKAEKVKNAVLSSDRGGKEIIVELGLAGIAVALLLVYRTQINTLVTSIMSEATTKITSLFAI